MTATTTTLTTEARALALAFAVKYPTPAVREAIGYAQSGRVEWTAVAALFARSYGEAKAVVNV